MDNGIAFMLRDSDGNVYWDEECVWRTWDEAQEAADRLNEENEADDSELRYTVLRLVEDTVG